MTASTAAPREDRERIPRALRLGMLALVLATLAGTAALRLAGVPPTAQPPVVAEAERVAVVLTERPGGGTELRDPVTRAVLGTIPAEKDGFLRGLIRVLGFERGRHRIEGNPPVDLVRWADGRLSLADPATGWRMEFQGFGQDNVATVARLMSDISDEREVSHD